MSKKMDMQATRDVHEGTLNERTAHSPEKVHLGHGVEVILNTNDGERTTGIMSEEGLSGFLVAIEKAQVQFLDMNPDLYSPEHAHDFGFIIYTVQGEWVLCSEGRRCLMRPGSICSIMANSSMGMEVPFENTVRALYFLEGGVDVQRRYEEYLRKLNEGTVTHHVSRMTRISELPEDHPARVFARLARSGPLD